MAAAPALTIAPELASKVRLGVLVLHGVTVREADATLSEDIERACRSFRDRHRDVPSGSVPGVEEARLLYKALGIDPTKTRPSNEALLRRALKGEPLYRINTLVDAINLCSLAQQLPYGLYDLAQIEGPVILRVGRPGESYEGIRKGLVSVAGRPTLVDAKGAFGNPTSDSARTSITLSTRSALVVIYAPQRFTAESMGRVLSETEATVVRHCGGTALARLQLPD